MGCCGMIGRSTSVKSRGCRINLAVTVSAASRNPGFCNTATLGCVGFGQMARRSVEACKKPQPRVAVLPRLSVLIARLLCAVFQWRLDDFQILQSEKCRDAADSIGGCFAGASGD